MSMSDQLSQMNAGVPAEKPGQILKAAREKLGLTQKEVATQMNLQTTTIDAVENDAEERLPAATFVRGYIRSYAKIVNLDGDALIKLYDSSNAAAPPEIIPEIKTHTQASSHDKPVKAMTYLVTFGLVLLLIAWLQSQYVVERDGRAEKITVTGELEEFEELPPPATATSPAVQARTPAGPPSNAPGLTLDLQETLPEIPEAISGTIELPEATTPDDTGGAMEPGAVTPDDTGVVMESDQTEAMQEPLFSTDDKVLFRLTQESWIEVYDSGNNRLYLGLARPGEEIHLSGVAPFDVLLGYAPGVEVRFNGKPYDPQPHSNAGIARFKLGEQENQAQTE